jgi:hypothetical protein
VIPICSHNSHAPFRLIAVNRWAILSWSHIGMDQGLVASDLTLNQKLEREAMKKISLIAAFASFGAFASSSAFALESPADQTTKPKAATTESAASSADSTGTQGQEKTVPDTKGTDAWSAANSDKDYSGKRIKFPVQIIATVTDAPNGKNRVCIPAETGLRGMSALTASGILVTLRRPEGIDDKAAVTFSKKCKTELDVKLDDAFEHPLIIAKTDVDALRADVNGLSYGLLFVPFKYHFSGSKDFKSSGSVGPYAGWKTESAGWASSLEVAGFLGLSSVAVEQNVDGKTTKNDLSALSFGVAFIGRIRQNFQVGLVIGADRVSASSKYVDNGKPWIAVSVGYSFSQ